MKTKTLFSLFLFISLGFFSFAIVGLLIVLVVKGALIYIPEPQDKKGRNEMVVLPDIIKFGDNQTGITAYNIFDPAQRNISPAGPVAGPAEVQGAEIKEADLSYYLENPEYCVALTGVKLIGTAMAIPETESSAAFQTSQGGSVRSSRKIGDAPPDDVLILGVDEEVTPGTTILAIRRNLVAFKTTGGIRCLGDGVGEKAGQDKMMPEIASSTQVSKPENDDVSVRKVGDNQFVVTRAEITKATTNLNALASQARIVPDRQENGFKIFSIRPDSFYSKIGIENGDVLKSINGIELSSPDKALEAYQRLRNADKLSIDIVRRGKKETLEYTVE